MAKVYGARWQLIDRPALGHGGQGTVFRVKDLSGEHQGEFALKRVPDITRRERFRREIDAIKRLTAPRRIRRIPISFHWSITRLLTTSGIPKSNFSSCQSPTAAI